MWLTASIPSIAAMRRFAEQLAPHRAALDRRFRRLIAGHPPAERKALLAIVSGAAAVQPLSAWLEALEYYGRRLAKLNITPAAVGKVLAQYDRLLSEVAGEPVRRQLRSIAALAVNRAFYEVREAEATAFYGLFRAEADSSSLADLLGRSAAILANALRARSGRIAVVDDIPAGARRKLTKPRYSEQGMGSRWSISFLRHGRLAAVAEFDFDKPYRWLPRELDLLAAAGERCLAAIERARLVRDLAAGEAEVRRLAGHLQQVEERERRRISRELHDGVGQSLLFLRLQLETTERDTSGKARARLSECREVAASVIQEIRRILAALSPAALDELGLPAALRQLAARFRKVAGARVNVRVAALQSRLPRTVETVLYRVAQECFHNAARHAQASRINLSLRSADSWLELSVADNGRGFEPAAALARPDAFGLAGMRERVELLGGRFRIRSAPGRGAAISVRLPLLGKHAEDAHSDHG